MTGIDPFIRAARKLSTIWAAHLGNPGAGADPCPVGNLSDTKQALALIARWGPVIHLRDADAAGVSRGVIRRLVDRGDLQRLAKSAFAPTDTVESAGSWEIFRLRSIAFGLCSGPDVYLTGEAAAAVLGLPMISDPPDLPTALRPGSAHIGVDRSPYGRVRHGHLPPAHRTRRDRVGTVSPGYCAVDVARHVGSRDGLVMADMVLRTGLPRESLVRLTSEMERDPGMATARWVVEHADPRAESPLESLGRFAFLSAGLPAPLSNVWIPVQSRWYRADHLLPEAGVILEADGAIKYNDQPNASALINDDRTRERLLRGLTFGLARYDWGVALHRPAAVVARAREAEQLRFGRPAPTCWTLTPPWAA